MARIFISQLLILVSAALLVVTTSAARTECSTTIFRTGLDYPNSSTEMRVSKDSVCGSALRSRYQPGVIKTFHGVVISERPSHGIAGRSSAYLFAYKPKAGYSGPDHFVVTINFDENGANGETLLDVNVDVVDKP